MPKTRWTKVEENEDFIRYHVQGWIGKRGFAKTLTNKRYSRSIEFDRIIEKGEYYIFNFDIRKEENATS